jgi:Ca2+-binding EF-hand superfamily protein
MTLGSVGLNLGPGVFGTGRMHGPPGDLDEATDRLIKDKDKDGDGLLSALEICISDEAFKQADANGDGKLDAEELKNGVDAIGKELARQDPHGPPPPPLVSDDDDDATDTSTLEEVFQQADTNGDGVLSADEFEAAADEIAKSLQSRHPQGPPPPPPGLDAATERLVQNLDENGDGVLSRDELGISQEVFDKVDADGDGQLTAGELKAATKSIAHELAAQEAAREAVLRQYSLLDYIGQGSNAAETGLNVTT